MFFFLIAKKNVIGNTITALAKSRALFLSREVGQPAGGPPCIAQVKGWNSLLAVRRNRGCVASLQCAGRGLAGHPAVPRRRAGWPTNLLLTAGRSTSTLTVPCRKAKQPSSCLKQAGHTLLFLSPARRQVSLLPVH